MRTTRINTLQVAQEMFRRIFGRNNKVFFGGLGERIDFLNIVIGDLQDVLRKCKSPDVVKIALARVVSFAFCVADNFENLPIANAMCLKYPDRCGHCHENPCTCPPGERSKHSNHSINPRQLSWTFGQWQQHLKALYGEKNRSAGLDYTVLRLFKEVCELFELQAGVTHVQSSAEEIEHEFALEISDILAWCMAVANILEIDLEDAIINTYGDGCPTCKKKRCDCRRYIIGRTGWQRTASATTLAKPATADAISLAGATMVGNIIR